MPRGKLETLQDCEDFVRGCLFMGTGGGGSVAWGMGMPKEALEDGIALEWVDVDDIPNVGLSPVLTNGATLPSSNTPSTPTEFGLNEASGPRYFGFDIDYVPIEELVVKRE
jgi:DUF917 family protein